MGAGNKWTWLLYGELKWRIKSGVGASKGERKVLESSIVPVVTSLSPTQLYQLSPYHFYLFVYFWSNLVACRIQVPGSGIKPIPSAMEVWSPNHRSAREVPSPYLYLSIFLISFPIFWWVQISTEGEEMWSVPKYQHKAGARSCRVRKTMWWILR